METKDTNLKISLQRLSEALLQNTNTDYSNQGSSLYFTCPLCGSVERISNAKHYLKEVNREYYFDKYRVVSYNFRICPQCAASIRKGYFISILLWIIVGVVFYTIFAYIYFYVDNITWIRNLFGELCDRSGGDFFCIFIGLTIFGSWIPGALCYLFSTTFLLYKSDGDITSKFNEAIKGNALAPIDEKDQK